MSLALFQTHLKKRTNQRLLWGFVTVLVITFLVMAALLLLTPQPVASVAATVRVNDHRFHVTVAQSEAQRERGLSGRTSLNQDEGMVFLFPSQGIYPFWMPEMRFPLDIIWIRQNAIVEMAQLDAPSIDHPEPELHTPTEQADMVLEVPAGTAQALQLRIGDPVSIVQ